MYIVEPITITNDILDSSTVTETDASEWSSITAYTAGQQVIVTTLSTSNTVASAYLSSHRGNNVAGNAYFWAVGANLTAYVGTDTGSTPCTITLTDSAGKKAVGYVGAGGTGPVNTLIKLPVFKDEDGYWDSSGTGVRFHPLTTYNTLGAASSSGLAWCDKDLVAGQLYYSSFVVSSYTGGSVQAFYGSTTGLGASRSSAATHTEYATGVGSDGYFGFDFTSATMTITTKQLWKVSEPPSATTGGVHVVSEPNGTYRAWASVESGFNWNEIATYEIEGNVTPYHRVYECLVNNTGYFPPANAVKWLDTGATNRWRVFDGAIQVQTSRADSIQYVLSPGSIDSVAFFNLDADSVTILLTNGGSTVYDTTITLNGATNTARLNIPSGYTAGVLTLTITKTGSTAKCGEIVVGLKYNAGTTLADSPPEVGKVDYSYKEVDDFGDYYIVEGAYSQTGDFDVLISMADVDNVVEELASVRATPVVYVGDENYASSIVYGFYKDFSFSFNEPDTVIYHIYVVGLT